MGLGGADRDRTDDLLHAMQALFQLSYGPLTGEQDATNPRPWQAKIFVGWDQPSEASTIPRFTSLR